MNINRYRTIVAATAAVLVITMSNVVGAFPSRGGSCTACHSSPGGSLTASPNPLDIQVGQAKLLTFSITSLGGSSTTAISVQGLENSALNASIAPGGDTWTYRTNATYGNSYVSNDITSIGLYTLNLMIGSLATPGTYPIVVMYAGDGEAGTDSGFTLRVLMAALAGDYNQNGSVDAADYTVWRDTLGSTTDLRANGDNTGASADVINQADYAVWKMNFGQSGSGSAITIGAVPEPATMAMLMAGLSALMFRPARCGRQYRAGPPRPS